ncbi:hypothetical protein [Acaryochloris marina]|uniref:Uncharacterized protein n=1 Tax=Acaryochloris marina (strain MBIC 11017) TaxID=329726 RepID=A8ZLT7_ACAM1|nr:hypothetical protein [Acaryochloris marina]ABW32114.1 hypothetical protein AM1_B0396 [Acaryochloris marina MBIC11017]BDM83089.1 hypothetical protein AM10699_59500 [Acaryochloris marina MBIC10699]
MSNELFIKGPHVPIEERALERLKRAVELGELEKLPNTPGIPNVPRYLVTYMNSQTVNTQMRSATVVSVTNQSNLINRVFVTFFKGFTDDSSPIGTAAFAIPPQFTVDFASRSLPSELTVTNAVPNPELTFDEGRAIVSSMWPEIGVSARVYYTAGDNDERLHAITDSKVVIYSRSNSGD